MLKRMLCLILAAVMAVAFAACSDEGEPEATGATAGHTEATAAPTVTDVDTTEPVNPATADETDPTESDEDDGIDMKAFIRDFDRTPQIEEQTVYEEDGVKVSALNLSYDPINGTVVRFRVENGSEKDLLVQTDTCAVNGYMMKAALSVSAPAGKTAEGEMTISYPSLALAGVSRIATLEYTLLLIDRSTYEVMTVCEPAVMQTTAFEDYDQSFDDEGQTVYDERGVRIVLKNVDRRRQVSDDPVLIVYMHNASDRTVSILAKSLLVNGYEMTPAMTTTVMPEKHAVDVVTIFEMDMQEHDIDEIETVEVSFRIVDEETWETVAETETVLLEEE